MEHAVYGARKPAFVSNEELKKKDGFSWINRARAQNRFILYLSLHNVASTPEYSKHPYLTWCAFSTSSSRLKVACMHKKTKSQGNLMFTLKTHTRARMCSSHHRNSTYVTPNFDEVVEANPVIGENDAVVKIRVEDISQLDKFLTDKLRTLPDVFLTTTMIITEQFK